MDVPIGSKADPVDCVELIDELVVMPAVQVPDTVPVVPPPSKTVLDPTVELVDP